MCAFKIKISFFVVVDKPTILFCSRPTYRVKIYILISSHTHTHARRMGLQQIKFHFQDVACRRLLIIWHIDYRAHIWPTMQKRVFGLRSTSKIALALFFAINTISSSPTYGVYCHVWVRHLTSDGCRKTAHGRHSHRNLLYAKHAVCVAQNNANER